jgi:TerC family integral membrane protein
VQQQQKDPLLETTTTTAKATPSSDVTTTTTTMRTDLIRTGGWVAAAVAFGLYLGQTKGSIVAEEFFAGYLIEQSLSVDNLFVFLLLFESFGVKAGSAQQKVLNYGIAGAVIMRAGMIGLGVAALQRFRGILLIFAAILLYSSYNLLFAGGEEEEEGGSTNAIIQFSKKIMATTDTYDGDNFFSTIEPGKATPLFACMIAVELSDIVFAVDSIPAVFGVTEVRTCIRCHPLALNKNNKYNANYILRVTTLTTTNNRIPWWF